MAHRSVPELLRLRCDEESGRTHHCQDRTVPLFFYSNEGTERPHVHVQHESRVAKFWLSPVALAASGGFSAAELRTVEGLVTEQGQHFLEAWNEFFRGRSQRPGDGR